MTELIYNLTLLIAMSIISGFIANKWRGDTTQGQVYQGLLFGFVAIIGMINPMVFEPGLIFDGRSVIISLCALFFGPLSVLIAGGMAIAYRIALGGTGVIMGISVITASALIGLHFHYRQLKRESRTNFIYLLRFGLLVHLAMLILSFTLPIEIALSIIHNLGIPIIIFFPLATVLVGKVLLDQQQYLRSLNALHESEQRWKFALEGAGDGVWDWDLTEQKVYYSPRWKEMLGYTNSDIGDSRDSWVALIHPEDRERRNSDLQKHFNGKTKVYRNEHRVRCKDGSYKWVLDRGKILEWSPEGRPLRMIGTYTDIDERKNNERIMRDRQKLLLTIADNILGPAARVDRELRYLFVNKWHEQSYSMPSDKIVGQTMPEIMGEEHFGKVKAHTEQALSGRRVRFEVELNISSGKRSYEMTYIPDKHPQGYIDGFFIVGHDITDQRQAEKEIRFQAHLLNTVSQAIMATDLNGSITYWNKAAERLYGWRAEEVMGKNVLDIIPAFETRDRAVLDGLKRGQSWSGEFRVRRKDGSVFFAEVTDTPLFDVHNTFVGVVGISADITERKNAELALRESERRLSTLISNLPGIVYRCKNDRNWTMEFLSEGCRTLTGYSAADLLDSKTITFTELIDSRDRERIWEEVQHAIRSGDQYQLTYRIRTAHGEKKWVWEKGKAVYGERGEIIALEGFITDITEWRKAEEEIRRLNLELEQRVRERTAQLQTANEELESFAYSVSHDLRAPLRAIDGFSRFLLEDYSARLNSEGVRLLNVIRANTQKMDQLITDLLALSRVTRAEMNFCEIQMETLVKSVYDEVADDSTRSQFDLSVQPLPSTYADEVLMRQVWHNLISNAIKYSRKSEKKRVEIGGDEDTHETMYFIRDYGAGFDPRYKHKLFTVFQRLHHASEFEGTGVGLAIVQRIIHRHGGKVWAEGDVGKGATFYFSLPRPLKKPQ